MSEVAQAKGSWSFVCDNYGSATLMCPLGEVFPLTEFSEQFMDHLSKQHL